MRLVAGPLTVLSPGPSIQLTSEQFIHDAGWCEGSGVVSTRTGEALSLFAMNWLQQSSKALWKTLLQLTGTCFVFGASNKACEARTSMLVFLQSFHPRERGDVRSGLFASAPVGLMALLGRRAYSVTVTRHCMACSLWRSTAVYLKDYWHSAHFWLSTRCTSVFSEFRPCCLH